MELSNLPTISVVIPTYNEQDYIHDCLNSLFESQGVEFEVMVVDDGSSDQTFQIVERDFPKAKLFKQNHQGPGAARNLGAAKALGNILVFVDADMTFEADFLDKLTAPILRGETIGTFSREEYVANPNNFWSKWWNINASLPPERRLPIDHPDEQVVYRAILKSQFDEAGGFTEGLGWDDDHTLHQKLGIKAKAAPGAKYYHKNPATLCEVFNQARWMGKSSMVEQNWRGFVRYFPLNPFRKGWKEAVGGKWFLPVFRAIYGAAVITGMIDVRLGGSKAQ